MDQDYFKKEPSKMKPVLIAIHEMMVGIPLEFRDSVCKELDISKPTYYRRMREKDDEDQSQSPSSRIEQKQTEIVVSLAYMELVKAVNYIKDNFMPGKAL